MAAKRRRSVAGLAEASADAMREKIYEADAGTRIGSLRSIAEELGVGIVTVQQAARVLEHEGLLEVRRGPGGGYYGKRPDAAALERSLSAYLRTESASWEEVLDITSLLFNELAGAAAGCTDPDLKADLARFLAKVEAMEEGAQIVPLEQEFQDLLFHMVARPLFELLTRVALTVGENHSGGRLAELSGDASWREGRIRIITAILDNDAELARFEANRRNRLPILRSLTAAK